LDGAMVIRRKLVEDFRPNNSAAHGLVDLSDVKKCAVAAEAGAER
jgi:hypothetical protein